MARWKDYHFVSSVFPQTYSMTKSRVMTTETNLLEQMFDLDSIEVHSINEYMKMVRGMQPHRKFKRVKVGNLGWDIKVQA